MMMGYSAMIQPFLTENVFYNQGANENPGKNRDQAKTPSFAGDPIVEPPWWNTTWQYRKIVEINASSVDRENSLFEIWINFSAELGLAGKIIDNNSIRVVEYDLLTGNQLVHDANYHPYDESAKYEIPSSLWYAVGYSSSINAYIKVSWVMNGTTAKNVIRGYAIYFDTTEHDPKASPTYWAFTSSNMTIPQGERINGVSIVTRSLLTLNSSKVAVFLSNNLTTNTQYNGQVLRMWYTGDPSNPKMSEYRVNETFINYNYYQVSYYRTDTLGWTGPTTITIPAASIIIRDNKIILQNVQPSAHSTFYSLNITYEIFERSQFVKVTFTVLKKSIDLGIVRIAVWGDLNPSIGITQTTASHRNAEGNTSSVTSTSKWDCYWHNNASYKDFHGFMVSPSAWFNFTGSVATYRAQTDISNIITGSTGEDSIFQVTAPKGIGPGDSIYSPLDRLYNNTFIPKTYTLYDAKEKRASITVRVTD